MNESRHLMISYKRLRSCVDAALDDIRPHLKVDGGDVEVVDVTEENVVQVRWLGNCENCFMSAMTMKAGIEEAIKNKDEMFQSNFN